MCDNAALKNLMDIDVLSWNQKESLWSFLVGDTA